MKYECPPRQEDEGTDNLKYGKRAETGFQNYAPALIPEIKESEQMIRGRIGERMVIARFDDPIKRIEIKLLERSFGYIKVKFLTDEWTKSGSMEWIRTGFGKEEWYKISRRSKGEKDGYITCSQ